MVTAQAAVCFLLRFLFRHAVFDSLKITDAFTDFALGHVHSSARSTVVKTRFRNLNICGDNMMVSEIFVNIGRDHFCSGDRFDHGRWTGCTVPAGEDARNILEAGIFC